MTIEIVNDFDNRDIIFENIHDVDHRIYKNFIDKIEPKNGEFILDLMCGYGHVSKLLLSKNSEINLSLLDSSELQISKAKENLVNYNTIFIHDTFQNAVLDSSSFDKTIFKMGLHEIPKNEQLKVLNKINEILNKNSCLFIWDIFFEKYDQEILQSIIKKKDELALNYNLAKNRYFLNVDEIIDLLIKSKFRKIQLFDTFTYRFCTITRTKYEFNGDLDKKGILDEFILKSLNSKMREKYKFKVNDTIEESPSLSFDIPCSIYIALK